MPESKELLVVLRKIINNNKLNEDEHDIIEDKITRKCNKCNEIKKIKLFYIINKHRGGRDPTCKRCKKKDIAQYNRIRTIIIRE